MLPPAARRPRTENTTAAAADESAKKARVDNTAAAATDEPEPIPMLELKALLLEPLQLLRACMTTIESTGKFTGSFLARDFCSCRF